MEFKPHKTDGWINSPDRHDPAFDERVARINELYRDARRLRDAGVRVVSTDEKTGMQALECAAPTLPTRCGDVEKREFEYVRHGTGTLSATLDVATGSVIKGSLGSTRTEEDFVAHVRATVATDPDATWVFVADQLNTHKSAGLVAAVAQLCGIEGDLGVKGKSGVLCTMESRAAFLEDPDHRIRFVFTPRHASWMNQIEIWFGILARKLLRRASFMSVAELLERVRRFIGYFNETMAKPFRWTYGGRPCTT